MNYKERLNQWLLSPVIDDGTKEELRSITDEGELEDRFYRDLEFGTAGLRGKLGAGTNRMNPYVVAKATQGLANTILKYGEEAKKRGVAIAWDVRMMSREFSEIAAGVLAAAGIHSYLFEDIRPTPMLSFAVRELGTISGIVITASHNPKDYNGYKVYWEEGSQIREQRAEEILREIEKVSLEDVSSMDFQEGVEKGLIHRISQEVEKKYYDRTLSMAVSEDLDRDLKVVYTPLNGTGNLPVRYVLKKRGFQNVSVVPEQEMPDGTFATVGYPNPEDVKAFEYALRDAKALEADLVLATDPDCDRVAMMAPMGNGEFYPFNGNQTGAMLLYYILKVRHEQGSLPENGAVVKSVVTGDFGFQAAKEFGVHQFQTLTGFKNICALPNLWDKTGEFSFLFGYEESIGYVYGDHVRDKDAVVSSMMITEMAAYYKKRGKSLYDVLLEMYDRYGTYDEDLLSLVYEGKEGSERIGRMMEGIRRDPFVKVNGQEVLEVTDFKDGYREYYDLGATNLLQYRLQDGSKFSLRPSGTEPKIKLYIYTVGNSKDETKEKLAGIKKDVLTRLESID